MSSMEMVDVMDEVGNVVASMTRSEAEDLNHTTQNALVFVFNSLGKAWIQLRPKSKKHFPGMWDISACGGLMTGETPHGAAMREVKEEMGLEIELIFAEKFLNIFDNQDGTQMRRLSHLFIGFTDEVPLVTEEVDEFKLVDLN